MDTHMHLMPWIIANARQRNLLREARALLEKVEDAASSAADNGRDDKAIHLTRAESALQDAVRELEQSVGDPK